MVLSLSSGASYSSVYVLPGALLNISSPLTVYFFSYPRWGECYDAEIVDDRFVSMSGVSRFNNTVGAVVSVGQMEITGMVTYDGMLKTGTLNVRNGATLTHSKNTNNAVNL